MALADNMTAYWSLDEASGNAIDAHAANDLTDNNTVGSATGLVGNARDFEADNSEDFSIADNADLSAGDIDFSFSLWFKTEGVEFVVRAMLYKGDGGQYEYLLMRGGGGGISFSVCSAAGFANETTVNSTASIFDTNWHHVACGHDSVNNLIWIQVDDETRVTQAYSHGCYDSTKSFILGSQAGIRFWDGLLDECGFWKRTLTTAEVTELYNAGAGRDYAYIAGGAPPATNRRRRLLLCGAAR